MPTFKQCDFHRPIYRYYSIIFLSTLSLCPLWGLWSCPSSSSLVPKQHPTLQFAKVLVSSCPGPGLREIKELQEEEGKNSYNNMASVRVLAAWLFSLLDVTAWFKIGPFLRVWNPRTYRCFCNATEAAWGNKGGGEKEIHHYCLKFWGCCFFSFVPLSVMQHLKCVAKKSVLSSGARKFLGSDSTCTLELVDNRMKSRIIRNKTV